MSTVPRTPSKGERAGVGGPVVCVDVNGVLDEYTGWQGSEHFDPPREGARAFLEALVARGFAVVVFTTRHPDGVWRWLHEHDLAGLVQDVTDRKPPAHVFVDDRAVCFRGDFLSTLEAIERFRAHWEDTAGPDGPDRADAQAL